MYLIAIGKSRFEGILGHFEIHAAFFTSVYFILDQGVVLKIQGSEIVC